MPRILTIFLAAVMMFGILLEIKPALARRGADDSQEYKLEDQRRGRGQDDLLEDRHRREDRRGQHHLQEDQEHRRGRGRDGDRDGFFEDDSKGRGRGGDGR